MRRNIVVVLVLVGIVAIASGAALTERSGPPAVVEESIKMFFKDLSKGQIDEAYRKLLSGMTIPVAPLQLQAQAGQTRTALGICGGYLGSEKISDDYASPSIFRARRLYKGQNTGIMFDFIYYRPRAEWKITGVWFNTDLNLIFK